VPRSHKCCWKTNSESSAEKIRALNSQQAITLEFFCVDFIRVSVLFMSQSGSDQQEENQEQYNGAKQEIEMLQSRSDCLHNVTASCS